MAVTENLDAYFDGFGQAVSFTDSSGETVSCTAIFDNGFSAPQIGDLVIETTDPVLTCKTSDISGIESGDSVTVESITYKVIQIQPDGTGISTVFLGKNY